MFWFETGKLPTNLVDIHVVHLSFSQLLNGARKDRDVSIAPMPVAIDAFLHLNRHRIPAVMLRMGETNPAIPFPERTQRMGFSVECRMALSNGFNGVAAAGGAAAGGPTGWTIVGSCGGPPPH